LLRRRRALAMRRRGCLDVAAGMRRSSDLGLLNVGGVIAAVAARDRVLAGLRQHLELVRQAAADRAGVGLDRAELESHAREDAPVGLEHVLVFAPAVLHCRMEAVSVLHDELAPTHEAEARTHLVAKLGLNL